MNEPLVSVVTPVYNTGEFIEQAICSVLSQTYRNFEYVICDNFSTDNTGEIAARYAAIDPRIRVVKPPRFLPQAENYNFALQRISEHSRYTKTIMADDWLFPICLQEMVACAEQHPSVGIVSSYRLTETQGDGFGLPVDTTLVSGRAAGRMHMLEPIWLFGTASTLLYSSDVVRARAPDFYPPDRFFFDTDAAFRILMDYDLGFVHQVLTFSRYQPGSITDGIREFFFPQIDRVLFVHQYGRHYLTSDEFNRTMSSAWFEYYNCLGQQWLLDRLGKRKSGFWDFHEKRLAELGLKLDPKRLVVGAAISFLRTASMPGEFVRHQIRARRKARKSSAGTT
jgi:glycosyltransferase involved in cell wall biosynthesis